MIIKNYDAKGSFMTAQLFLIFHITMISVFQIYGIIHYLHRGEKGKFFSNLIAYGIILALIFYEYYSNLNIPSFIITCSLLAIVGHSFIGTLLDVYHRSKTYDRYLHLFGSFSFALLVFSILDRIIVPAIKSKIYVFLFVMTLGITIGVFFEIIEFVHDRFSKKVKCQHGLADTDFDMIFNIAGSFLAAMVAIRIFK